MEKDLLLKMMEFVLRSDEPRSDSGGLFDRYIGKKCIVRTRNAGVIFGEVVCAERGAIVLKNARRIWRTISKDKSQSWYEGIANSGLCEDKGVISSAVSEKALVEDYEVNICSAVAAESLEKFTANGTDI